MFLVLFGLRSGAFALLLSRQNEGCSRNAGTNHGTDEHVHHRGQGNGGVVGIGSLADLAHAAAPLVIGGLELLAAFAALVPVARAIAAPCLIQLVLSAAQGQAGVALDVTVVVVIVGSKVLLGVALAAGIPVSGAVRGELVGKDMLMVQRRSDDISADGAGLIGGLRGGSAGLVGGGVLLFTAVGALVPVVVLVVLPLRAEAVGGGAGIRSIAGCKSQFCSRCSGL